MSGDGKASPFTAKADKLVEDAKKRLSSWSLFGSSTTKKEDAAEMYNSHPYGLSAAVFTEDERRFHGVARMLRAGAVNWNRGTIVASARFPNAALARSGLGARSNAALLDATTFPQSRLGAAGRFDPTHRVPGMEWPPEMGVPDPTSARTPPYVPGQP